MEDKKLKLMDLHVLPNNGLFLAKKKKISANLPLHCKDLLIVPGREDPSRVRGADGVEARKLAT